MEYADSPSQGAWAQGQLMSKAAYMERPRTPLEQLGDMEKQLENKLEEIRVAKKLLEDSPGIHDILVALRKVGL